MPRWIALLALLLALPNLAHAQDPQEQARQHYAAGRRLVEEGRMVQAYAEFEAGYALSQRPLFLFNMAEAARQMDEHDRARTDYERYLAAEPHGAMSATARGRLEALPAATTEPTPPGHAEPLPDVRLPEEPPNRAPMPPPAEPPPDEGGDDAWIILTVVLSAAALAGAGVALGVHFGTQGPECGPGCVDFR